MLSINPFILRKYIPLFIVVLLFNLFCQNVVESFIINKNPCTISHFSNKNAVFKHNNFPNNDILDSSNTIQVINNTHQPNEAANDVNSDSIQKESDTSHNLLTLLCGHSHQVDILHRLSDCISQNDSPIKRIMYISTSLQKLYDTVGSLSNKYQNKMNIIDFDMISLYTDSVITFSYDCALNQYLYAFINDNSVFIKAPVSTFNGVIVTESNRAEFLECLKSLLFSFFMDKDELQKSTFSKNPVTSFNSASLTPANKWIDDNYVDTDYILNNIKNVKDKQNLVFLADFSFNYHIFKDELHYKFFEYPLLHLKKNSAIIASSKQLYNTQNVTNWLHTLFGDFKTVSMSKTPEFKLLTSFGHTDIFTDEPVTYASKFNKLHPGDTKELYKYFTKKSNLAKLTNINPAIKNVLANVVIDSLRHRGINSYHKLIRANTKVRDILKGHIRELRKDMYFNSLRDKMSYLISSMIDVPNNKTLSNLVQALNLTPVIRERQIVPTDRLISYIKEQNLYPTVIYCFEKDLRGIQQELMNYVLLNQKPRSNSEDGSSDSDMKSDKTFDLDPDVLESFKLYTSHTRISLTQQRLFEHGFYIYLLNLRHSYKNFANENMDKLKVIVSNCYVPGAKHYIFLSSSIQESATPSIPNILLYSYTQGAKLVTFTFDMDYVFHNFRSLVSPIYFNMSNIIYNDTNFSDSEDFLKERLFKTYLKECKKEYLKSSPDPFNLIRERDQIENTLSNNKIDPRLLLKLNSRIHTLERWLNPLKNKLIYRAGFRSKLIESISSIVNLIGSTVLGVDDRQYKILYLGHNPSECLNFKNEEDLSTLNNKLETNVTYVILQDVENKSHLMAKIRFLKDIVELPVEEDSKITPIDVSKMYFKNITSENDVKELQHLNNITFDYICLNEDTQIPTPKLSSMIPKPSLNKMTKQMAEHQECVKKKQDLINKATPHANLNSNEFYEKSEELENQCENYEKLENNLRKTSLEKILVEHRFKNSFWGR